MAAKVTTKARAKPPAHRRSKPMTGAQIRAKRKKLGLSLEVVGKAMGISGPFLSRLERGLLSSPRLKTAGNVFDTLSK